MYFTSISQFIDELYLVIHDISLNFKFVYIVATVLIFNKKKDFVKRTTKISKTFNNQVAFFLHKTN